MGNYRIMIVDDEEDTRRMIALALQPHYEVVEALDGLDALSKLDAYEPDFAIIDLMMPLMDGYQVCEAIRRHPRFRDMKIMFLSAYGSRENIKKGYAVGANLFLTKPVEPERIVKNIDFTVAHEAPPLRPKRYSLLQLMQMGGEVKPEPPATTPAVHPAADAAPAAGPAAAGAPALRPRILMVDDDEEMLLMLDLALRDRYEVTRAANGIEAIEQMADYQPDLMLIDVMMPKMNGYQLLQSIRRSTYFGHLPVVVLSAKSSPKDQEYALRLGANLFLPKPCAIAGLIASLEGITQAPGFRIRPKRLSLYEIRQHDHDRSQARREQFERERNDKRIQDILGEERRQGRRPGQ